MRATLLVSLLLAGVATTPVAADSRTVDGISIERTFEARTSMIVLPASAGGTLSYRTCIGCAFVTLSTTPTTRYQIGNRGVTLATMAKLFATGTYTALVAAKLNAPVLLRLEVYVPESATGVTTHEE